MAAGVRAASGIRLVAIALLGTALVACGGGGGESKNLPPTASFAVTPLSGLSPLTVTVDGSQSSDPEGKIASYTWSFGDDSALVSGVASTHTYSLSRTYTITLTVTDHRGASHSSTAIVEVLNRAPTAQILIAPDFGSAPFNAGFRASASDLDGTIANYAWSFGDGETGTGGTVEHRYAQRGSYAVSLVVTDNQGATASAAHQVYVRRSESMPAYHLREVDSREFSFSGSSSSLNNQGAVAGSASRGDSRHAAIYQDGIVRILDETGLFRGVTVLNDAGDAAGVVTISLETGARRDHAFLYSKGGFRLVTQQLPEVDSTADSYLLINERGDLAGTMTEFIGTPGEGWPRVGFLFSSGRLEIMSSPDIDFKSPSVRDMNESGHVVGSAWQQGPTDTEGRRVPFIFSDGVMRDLSPTRDSYGGATLINDHDDIIFTRGSIIGSPERPYFRSATGQYVDLQAMTGGTLTPVSLTNAGLVGGNVYENADTQLGKYRAVIIDARNRQSRTIAAPTGYQVQLLQLREDGAAFLRWWAPAATNQYPPVPPRCKGPECWRPTPEGVALVSDGVWEDITPASLEERITSIYDMNDVGQATGVYGCPPCATTTQFIATPIRLLFSRLVDATKSATADSQAIATAMSAQSAYGVNDASTTCSSLTSYWQRIEGLTPGQVDSSKSADLIDQARAIAEAVGCP